MTPTGPPKGPQKGPQIGPTWPPNQQQFFPDRI